MPTLYRKYRPQTFSSLTGQEHVVATIKNEIILGRVAHAYVFSGPRGVGKTTVARLLAKAVNCQKRDPQNAEPCNVCQSCLDTTAGRALDVLEIDAASHTGVDNVRENIIENARFQPTTSKYKVFIVDEVHMLSGSAFNALLKTLEEPPSHVIFILATTELHKLPATVISRCQRFQFKKIPFKEMLARLKEICKEEGVKVEAEVLERVVKKSDGCLRDAESLLGQILTLDQKKITAKDAELILPPSASEQVVTFLEAVVTGDAKSAFTCLNTLAEEGVSFDQFGLDLLNALRAMLCYKVGAEPPDESAADFSNEALKKISSLAGSILQSTLNALTDAALLRRMQIKTAPLPQLPFELLAAQFANTQSPNVPTPGELQSQEKKLSPPAQKTETKAPSLAASIRSAISTIAGSRKPPVTTLEQITNKWPELIAEITKENHSLTFILSMAKLERVDQDGLYLVFPYSLHKEKVAEHKNRRIIEECLQKTFGEYISVQCATAAEFAGKHTTPSTDSDLAGLALEFGGEVVN